VEIRRLRPAEEAPAVVRRSWGTAQRLLVGGTALMLVAAVAAAILYSQYPSDAAIERYIAQQRLQALSLKPWDAIQHYRRYLAPGIERPIDSRFDDYREKISAGLVIAFAAGAAGAGLAVWGVVGLVRKGSG
jgi:hypothetical protein